MDPFSNGGYFSFGADDGEMSLCPNPTDDEDSYDDMFYYVFNDSSPEFEDLQTNFQDYNTIQPKVPTTASEAFHVYDDSLDDFDQACYRTTTTGIDFLTDHAVHLQTGVT